MSDRAGIRKVHADVRVMLKEEGVYICGDTQMPTASIVIVSHGGRLVAMKMDQVLRPDGFLPTFFISSGPHTATPP